MDLRLTIWGLCNVTGNLFLKKIGSPTVGIQCPVAFLLVAKLMSNSLLDYKGQFVLIITLIDQVKFKLRVSLYIFKFLLS